MKHLSYASRLAIGCLAVLVALTACSSGGGSTATTAATPASGAPSVPAPSGAAATTAPLDEVQRTTFAKSLDIDFSKMMRRPSGLWVQDFETGTGGVAARERTVVIRYSGMLPDGKVFDSGEITIALGKRKVIQAWEDGVLGMRVGGKRRIVTPPHLAYGARGAPPVIPPYAVLVFDMTLTQVY